MLQRTPRQEAGVRSKRSFVARLIHVDGGRPSRQGKSPVVVNHLVPMGSSQKMQIYGPFRVSTTQSAETASRPTPPRAETLRKPSTPVDQLDLSSAGGEVNRLAASGSVDSASEIRVDRVAEIRRQIASGDYDTPEKLDAALDRFLDQYA